MTTPSAAFIAERARQGGVPLDDPGQLFPQATVFAGKFVTTPIAIPTILTGSAAQPHLIADLRQVWSEDPRANLAGANASQGANVVVGWYAARAMVASSTVTASQLTAEDFALLAAALSIRLTVGDWVGYFPLSSQAIQTGIISNGVATTNAAAEVIRAGTAPAPGQMWVDSIWANFNTDQVDLVATAAGTLTADVASATRLEVYGAFAKSLQLEPAAPCGGRTVKAPDRRLLNMPRSAMG